MAAEGEGSGDERATATLSWDSGPANSRLVRVVFYLAFGAVGGAVLAGGVLFGPSLVADLPDGGSVWTLVLAALFLIPVARVVGAILWADREGTARGVLRAERPWRDVPLWPWGAVAALAVAAGLLGVDALSAVDLRDVPLAVAYVVVLVAGFCSVLGSVLTSEGEVDPETLTLTYRDEAVDLRYLNDVASFALAGYTVLWLRFDREPGRARTPQDVYVIPASVADRARPVFAAGIDAAVETEERSRVFRRVNAAVALAGVAGSVGLLAVMAWVGSSVESLVQFAVLTVVLASGAGYYLLRTV